MPVLARFTNFCDFHGFRKAVATALLRISKIPPINFEINSYLFKKILFSTDANLCLKKLNLSSKLRDFSAMLPFTVKKKLLQKARYLSHIERPKYDVKKYLNNVFKTKNSVSLPEGERVAGFRHFYVPFFELCSRSRFSNILSAQGPILKFLSILGHGFFICPL